MEGIDGASRRTPAWQDDYDKPLPGAERKQRENVANAPWLTEPSRLGTQTSSYSPAMFSNPAMQGKPVGLAERPAHAVATPRSELSAAANARRGITLANLADGLPKDTRTDPSRAIRVGDYKLYPEVTKDPDGKDGAVYWTAFNTEPKRVEFVVGPDALETFKAEPKLYAVAAANGFMGEQDAATRESAKVVEIGLRLGFGAALRQLGHAWRVAGTDPKWVAKTAFNVATASAGASTTTRATCAEAKAESSAIQSSAASGTSPAGSAARAHTIADINPGFPTAPGRTLNCVNCAVATDATLARHPATALPSEYPLKLEHIQQVTGGTFRPITSPGDVEAQLLRSGPGSRAIVAGTRNAPEPGHVFNAVNVDGRVYFVDGQSGQAAVLSDPTYVQWSMLQTFPRKP
ncbi:MAG: hypothetical protein JWP97_4070 [Labilithrix sp.]|nr:hypothetical protein [Labilithrix sp.]